MLYADKQHLKTEVAVDLLRVREKEMNFYATNLSMVGTQSALLAGFAFAILAQNDFMFAAGGFWPQAWRAALGLRPIEEEYRVMKGWTEEEVRDGVLGWRWDVWSQQARRHAFPSLPSLALSGGRPSRRDPPPAPALPSPPPRCASSST